MFQNYFKIGLRNLLKNKLFSAINISGMAISIASFLIIALFVTDELSFDKHVEEVDLKYRVYNDSYNDEGGVKQQAMVPPMFAVTIDAEVPEVEYTTRFMYISSKILFEAGDKKINESNGAYADPSVFKMFSLPLVEGDLKTALIEPNAVAISASTAQKYFGNQPALGQSLEISNGPYVVRAVYEDFPVNSHIQLNYLLAMQGLVSEIPERMQSWTWQQFHTYMKAKPGADITSVEKKIQKIAEKNGWPKTKEFGSYYVPHLMEMKRVHLHAGAHMWDLAVKGNAQTVYILSATAIFILLISILNFVNLSTARAVNRVKEVGVRKVVGAFRAQLIYQFISESVLISLIALLIGGLVAELVLPALNSFTEKQIPTGIFLDVPVVISLLLFGLIVGVLAGAYPAFYISSYKPAQILSGKRGGKSGKTVLRQSLVVLQFILSFFLIIASLVVSDQHTYMRSKDMGFSKDNIVIVPLRGNLRTNFETTKHEFSNHPNIISSSLQYGMPGQAYAGDVIKDIENNVQRPISLLVVDHDYPKTLGLKFVAGRDFSKELATDTAEAFIVSESGAKLLGYTDPNEALGHRVAWQRWDNRQDKNGKIIGVVKDFHLNSLKESITPVIMHIFPFGYSSISFKVKSDDVPETIAHLEETWKKFNSESPFEYHFVDDNFDKLYKTEQKLATLFSFFTGFTIFVACLGLFGLVVYSTTQRYKEISIRKVLGAEETSLVLELGKSYLVLIAIAFVIAIPFSYYAAWNWLQKFPYRIDITPIIFLKAALFIIILSLITVGVQSLKAARSNPVDALKEQ
ncbi:MAG TPA: FtsX-like permease family protein [Chryseosolibacter sp.]|nr:FtsX-like permease family protein [Chryseosolibacter sp.]